MTLQSTHWGAEDLWLRIEPQLPGFTLEFVPSIDSTNSELLRRARAGQITPTLLVSEFQTAGRGRQGRIWVNQPGDCLMYSVGLMLRPYDWSGLSLVVGLSIAEALNAASIGAATSVGVKWPNDLWLNDGRKLGGTLIETANVAAAEDEHIYGTGLGPARFVVIGTGINIRPIPLNTHAGVMTTGCLQDVASHWTAPNALTQLLPHLIEDVMEFAQHGFAPFQARFHALDVLRGQSVHLSDGSQGQALGVAEDGNFLLQTPTGVQHVLSGDISVRPLHMTLPATSVWPQE